MLMQTKHMDNALLDFCCCEKIPEESLSRRKGLFWLMDYWMYWSVVRWSIVVRSE